MIVDTSPVFAVLNAYRPLSGALEKHLKQILSQHYYQKGCLLLRPGQVPTHAWFILEGSARGYAFDEEKGELVTAWFWYKGEILVAHDSFCNQVPTSFHIELLEDSVLQRISYEALEQTVGLFPSFRHLERAIVKDFLQRLYQHYQDRENLTAKDRFEKLMQEQPQLFNIAQVKDIASFLGMFPDTLSRLRSCK